MPRRLLTALAASLLVAAACGGSSTPGATPTATVTPSATVEATPTLVEQLDAIERDVSIIRGLESDREFELQFTSEAGLATLQELVGIEDDEGPLMTALGLGGRRSPLSTIDIEGGAYVEPPPAIFIVGSPSDGLDDREISIYVHEYVHFLQSSAFGIDAVDQSDVDGQFAQVALHEGDAVRSEQEYQRRFLEDVRPEASMPLGEELGDRFDRSITLFVYGGGAAFVTALGGVGSAAVDEAFSAPLTTEQIIHPEKFTSGEVGVPPSEAALIARLGLDADELIDRATLGEFFYLAWLTALRSGNAFSGASGWGGDLALVFNDGEGALVVLSLEWDDSATDVAEFDAALRSGLANSSTFLELLPGMHDAWQGPGGVLGFGSTGGTTTIIVAPSRERLEQLLAAALGP